MTVNKDQIKGAAKDIGGKIQEEVGKLIGSKEQEAKGLKHQAEGKMQRGVGDVKEAVSNLKDIVKKGSKPAADSELKAHRCKLAGEPLDVTEASASSSSATRSRAE